MLQEFLAQIMLAWLGAVSAQASWLCQVRMTNKRICACVFVCACMCVCVCTCCCLATIEILYVSCIRDSTAPLGLYSFKMFFCAFSATASVGTVSIPHISCEVL